MMRRRKLSNRKSRRMFTKGASRTHRKNTRARPQRGGIRL